MILPCLSSLPGALRFKKSWRKWFGNPYQDGLRKLYEMGKDPREEMLGTLRAGQRIPLEVPLLFMVVNTDGQLDKI